MKIRTFAIMLISFLGMIDTLYLSVKRGMHIPCTLTGGCDDVLSSQYSTLAGVPLSWIGLAFYLTVFSCMVFQSFGARNLVRLIFFLALPGVIISIVLVGIQAFVIKAFCEYCLGSAAFVTSIFLLSWTRRQQPGPAA